VKWGSLEIGELADGVHLRGALRPAAVLHFAALTDVGELILNPTLYYQNNVGYTAALLRSNRCRTQRAPELRSRSWPTVPPNSRWALCPTSGKWARQ